MLTNKVYKQIIKFFKNTKSLIRINEIKLKI